MKTSSRVAPALRKHLPSDITTTSQFASSPCRALCFISASSLPLIAALQLFASRPNRLACLFSLWLCWQLQVLVAGTRPLACIASASWAQPASSLTHMPSPVQMPCHAFCKRNFILPQCTQMLHQHMLDPGWEAERVCATALYCGRAGSLN